METDIRISLIPVLERFLEAEERARRIRDTAALEKKMARTVAEWFVAEGKLVVKALRPLAYRFDQNAELNAQTKEAITYGDWAHLVALIHNQTAPRFHRIIDVFAGTALMAGANSVLGEEPLLGAFFDLKNPRAVAYAQGHAARQVTRINQTTRDRLNTLITDAVDNGWSWDRTARNITEMYEDFAGPPLFPSKKFRSRAQAVAAFEIGDAYEAGSEMAAETLEAEGLAMEKSWLTVGDQNVRPTHRTNQDHGWIPLDDEFPSGHKRPPTDPGCRCTLLYRRAKIKAEPEPTGPAPASIPVSSAMNIPKSGKYHKAYKETLDAIDQVHGDGNLPQIPVKTSQLRGGTLGEYRWRRGGTPDGIFIKGQGEHIQTTLAHEAGHFLDHHGMGAPGSFATVLGDVEGIEEWRQATKGSKAIQKLEDMFNNPDNYAVEIEMWGSKFTQTPSIYHTRYLLDEREIWARSYAQYIAEESANETMLEQMAKEREDTMYGVRQWDPEDFKPIRTAINKLFKGIGWLQ